MLSGRLLPGLFIVLFGFCYFLFAPAPIHAQFNYSSFQASDFSFVGDAGMSGGALRLIRSHPNGVYTAAAVWHNQTQRVTDGFVTTFTFRILNPQNGGGDGFAFVLHSGGTSTIGHGSAQMGYADPGGIPNSLALEFDTYYNDNFGDPNADHLSLHTNYGGANNANESFSIGGSASPGITLVDGAAHVVRIEYDGPANSYAMRIFIDNVNVLNRSVNLSTILAGGGPDARIGFTAGAAGASENNDILSWSFNSNPNVTEVSYHQIAPTTQNSVPIDGNPLAGNHGIDYGLRHFPDKDFPQDDADRSTIRVDAKIGLNLPNTMVYFRFFDMDDPSVNSEIDPDVAGGDNRGGSAQLRIPPGMESVCVFNAAAASIACPTDSSGIASVNFTVSKQPGDNFAIVASTDQAEANAVVLDPIDGLHLLSGAASRLKDTCDIADKVCRSRLLTVWRRLHIETDSMPMVTDNHLDVKLVPPPPRTPKITIAAGETRGLDVYDPVGLTLEDGRFAAGRAVVGNRQLSVHSNTEHQITVTNTSLNKITLSYTDTIRLYDDDDFNGDDGADLIGDEGESLPSPDQLLIQGGPNGDYVSTNVLALAYIRPVYDIGGGLAQQFGTNIDNLSQGGLDPIISYDNAGTDGDEQFWTVYLLNAYQGKTDQDGDGIDVMNPPDLEKADVGFTLEDGMAISLVFAEPAGSKECNSRPTEPPHSCNLSAITAREVARALGANLGDGGLLALDSTVLSTASLNRLRGITVP